MSSSFVENRELQPYAVGWTVVLSGNTDLSAPPEEAWINACPKISAHILKLRVHAVQFSKKKKSSFTRPHRNWTPMRVYISKQTSCFSGRAAVNKFNQRSETFSLQDQLLMPAVQKHLVAGQKTGGALPNTYVKMNDSTKKGINRRWRSPLFF